MKERKDKQGRSGKWKDREELKIKKKERIKKCCKKKE
jgi:hypothetical protein